MNKKILLAFGLFFLLFSRLSFAAFFDPNLDWRTIETEHFNIHFPKGAEEVGLKMAHISERVYENLTPRYQWKPWGKTEIVLTDHTDVSNAFASVLPYNYILIYLTPPHGTIPLNYYDDWLEDLFTHEFTHILHVDKQGGAVRPFRWLFGKIVAPNAATPPWMREGIAVYSESLKGRGRAYNSFGQMMLRTDILNDQFLKIDEAAGFKVSWPSGNGAYIYGGAFIQYLVDRFGEAKLEEYMKHYGRSPLIGVLNTKAKDTFYNKSFYTLWKEWKADLVEKYSKQKQELETLGLTPLETLVQIKGNIDAPTLSPDASKLVYTKGDIHSSPSLVMLDLQTKKETTLLKGILTNQISFSPNSEKIVYSLMAGYKYFNSYYDLYEYHFKTKKVVVLTRGKRAQDPDYSPDGKTLVYAANKLGSGNLFLLDLETKKETRLTHAPADTQFSNPRFSPDGQSIAVSVWINGNRDLYLYNLDGTVQKQITQDEAIENEPRFSEDGKFLYFTSDRTGISNIYRYSFQTQQIQQISNVLTGLFYPQPVSGADQLIAQHYFGKGFNVVRFVPHALTSSAAVQQKRGRQSVKADAFILNQKTKPVTSSESGEAQEYKIRKYDGFYKAFIPRSVRPGIACGDGIWLFSAALGSSDPLGRHIWSGDITYRTDAKFLGGDFTYIYNRWWTPFYVGVNDYVVNYGDIFRINKNFFEERRRVFGGLRAPLKKHTLDFYYSFENRSDQSRLPAGSEQFLNFGHFGGLNFTYNYNGSTRYPASISREKGPRFRLAAEINDKLLGSSQKNETKVVEADFRYYLTFPAHHVLAFRAAGGLNFGDKLFQGIFRLGSDLGEGLIPGPIPHLYSLRGLPQVSFAGDRALLFSAEYRIPLAQVERGIGTSPFFLKNLHLALFADYGSVFDGKPRLEDFLLGVGGELRSDWIIGYGLPISARLGYGIIVKGRDFLGNRTDPILGTSIKNGALILQVGTSF